MSKIIASTWEESLDEKDIHNPIDPKKSDNEKVKELARLSKASKPLLKDIARNIDQKQGNTTSINQKLPDRIIAKAHRPEILKTKSWFDIEHVRDSLRFRTSIKTFENVEDIYKYLVARGDIEFVKVDLA